MIDYSLELICLFNTSDIHKIKQTGSNQEEEIYIFHGHVAKGEEIIGIT